MKKYIKGLNLIALLALGQAAAAKQPNESRVTLINGSWNPGEGGPVTTQANPLNRPFGVDFDSQGRMWIVELEGGRVHRLANGVRKQVGGDGSKSYRGDGGSLGQATFNGMHNLAIAPDDSVYIADSWNHCIRRIDASGRIKTFAGTGKAGFGGDGGPAAKAKFNYIMCITLNPSGEKLHVADLKNRRIREIDLKSDKVRTIAGNGVSQRTVPRRRRRLWLIHVRYAVTPWGMCTCLSAEDTRSGWCGRMAGFTPSPAMGKKVTAMAGVQPRASTGRNIFAPIRREIFTSLMM